MTKWNQLGTRVVPHEGVKHNEAHKSLTVVHNFLKLKYDLFSVIVPGFCNDPNTCTIVPSASFAANMEHYIGGHGKHYTC